MEEKSDIKKLQNSIDEIQEAIDVNEAFLKKDKPIEEIKGTSLLNKPALVKWANNLGIEEIKGTKAHTIYKNLQGLTVPSVTTVLSLLNKPALVKWANNLGLQGIDSTKYRDKLAEVGTLAHQLILDYFRKVKTDTSDYSKETIDKAENSFLSFLEWTKGKKIEPIFIEKSLVSEKYGFGGTPDFYGKIDEDLVVDDYKTGSGIYDEFLYQLSAYRELVEEQGFKVKKVTVIRIPRSSDEQFETKEKVDTSREWQIFLHLLGILYLKKEIRKEK